MARHWSGKLFIIPVCDGTHRITLTLPVDLLMARQIRVFNSRGPFLPQGLPCPISVDDPDAWLADHLQAGFVFTPGGLP